MSEAWTWVAIGGVTLTTFITRAGLLLLGERLRLPVLVDQALAYAPACALAAIIVPDLVLADGGVSLDPGNFRLLAALAAAGVFVTTRSFVATIAAGMAVFTALRLLA
jgi:branched-subunit amino acid transport protein